MYNINEHNYIKKNKINMAIYILLYYAYSNRDYVILKNVIIVYKKVLDSMWN